jgi:hypothetical protein
MSIYEILPALDLTQSVHAKISIGMHWVVKFKISRIPLIGQQKQPIILSVNVTHEKTKTADYTCYVKTLLLQVYYR